MTVVWVKWKDATFLPDGDWLSADDVDTETGFYCESAGILVKEDDHGLVLGGDFDPETDTYRYLTFIPQEMIRSRKSFTIPERLRTAK